jgi:hypothetical protein
MTGHKGAKESGRESTPATKSNFGFSLKELLLNDVFKEDKTSCNIQLGLERQRQQPG